MNYIKSTFYRDGVKTTALFQNAGATDILRLIDNCHSTIKRKYNPDMSKGIVSIPSYD